MIGTNSVVLVLCDMPFLSPLQLFSENEGEEGPVAGLNNYANVTDSLARAVARISTLVLEYALVKHNFS